MSRYRIGIDVGGTFTDFVLYDGESAATTTLKVPTTPDDPSLGIAEGLDRLGVPLAEVAGVAHGTTTATNALIERKGARTAFLTTEGHRDTLEIRRNNREELYDAQWRPPPALVRRRNRLEIPERLFWDGQVAKPLDEDRVRDVCETLRARDIEAVAVCFLHAYQHPRHERRVKELVQEALPDAFVTVSSEISQEFREFERGSTVAANAFVGPKVKRYMSNLRDRMTERGLHGDVAIMQSNGGVCTIDEAARFPAKLARSGPAGGAMALERLAELTGVANLVGIDIGGTSADVAMIVDGRTRWISPLQVEWGMPLLFPSVDVVSIGAGGGSIAWIDDGGALHMGPQSAGADPGPAAYGKGGGEPTSTDAHLVLGRVSSDRFVAGEMSLDAGLAEDAIRRRVGEPLGLSAHEAAEGMLQILDHNMLQAIRLVTVEKGYDPRDFALVGLGGGGPLHVVELARELGMSRALVPTAPGVLSAWGMLTVDMVQDRSRTVLKRRRAVDDAALSATLEELRSDIGTALERQGVDPRAVAYEYVLDMQYYGQVFSLPISLGDLSASGNGAGPGPAHLDGEALARAEERFHAEHEREYGHADRTQEVQVVHARVFGRAAVDAPQIKAAELGGPDASGALLDHRDARFDGEAVRTAIYDRALLAPGMELGGPAIVHEPSSTSVLPPGTRASVDRFGTIVIDTGVGAQG
jgi:N-methylhydantoinase A